MSSCARKKKLKEKKHHYILVSQTTKTNAKEKKKKKELKNLTLKKKKKRQSLSLMLFFVRSLTIQTKKKSERSRKNMIHNTYDAITTSEEKNIKIYKSQKKFTDIKEEKRYLF
jgi:hypothetical protein